MAETNDRTEAQLAGQPLAGKAQGDQKPAAKSQFAQVEEQVLARWNEDNTFQKSVDQRAGKPVFSFYDGPPFANGLPHFGHSLVTAIKDSLGRYKAMRGFYVDRRNGWDCHGLPVEFAIEKQFGVSGKKQILELGLDKFNAACRESVFMYKGEWEQFYERIGRWTDAGRAYATIDTSYTESVWWVLSQIHQKGLLYKGFKSMPYCPRCETPLSNFEVNEGYRDNVPDPSLFVKFKLSDEDAYLLGWTTTPWSLPGNAAIAVNPEEQYVYVTLDDDDGKTETLVLAAKRLASLNSDNYHIVKEISGQELVGRSYDPLFSLQSAAEAPNKANLYKVWPAPFVSVEDGTGVLHVAPAFGEDDLNLGLEHDIPVLQTIDASGHVMGGIGFDGVQGVFFKDADRQIVEHLTEQGMVYAAETAEHTYPFCYRCDSPLLYYAITTWFIRVSAIKDQLLKTAEDINWVPGHIKYGRFGKWLEGARDWAISRNRYWGAPMPVWVNQDDPEDYIVVDSIETLRSLAGPEAKLDDLHRPFIDEVSFVKDGKTYKRVEEVIDCWVESGSMPVAQQHYPFENQDVFAASFPADYIGEGLDQTRLWFYVMHVISTVLFEKPAYKNVLVNGILLAADGQKLSKRLKNYPPVEEVFANEGADTLRLYLLSNMQAVNADYMRFNRDAMRDLNRNVLGTLLNSYRFFKMYADIDNWHPTTFEEPSSTNVLDRWILARLNQTITEVTAKADDYKLAHAINPVFEFIDEMSNWYIRRSRRRFWKSEDDTDKLQAYATLWYVLMRVSQLLAPWAPFMSDYVWGQLVSGTPMPTSVHLSDWPGAGTIDVTLVEQMGITREAINQGLRLRAEAKLKIRQPLSKVTISGSKVPFLAEEATGAEFRDIIAEELNVKAVEAAQGGAEVHAALDTTVTEELKQEGLMRDLVRHIQNARKKAGLEVDDRIALSLQTEDEALQKSIATFSETIQHETLAVSLATKAPLAHAVEVKIEAAAVTISLQKA